MFSSISRKRLSANIITSLSNPAATSNDYCEKDRQYVIIHRSKRVKTNSYAPVPELLRNYETIQREPKSLSQLVEFIRNRQNSDTATHMRVYVPNGAGGMEPQTVDLEQELTTVDNTNNNNDDNYHSLYHFGFGRNTIFGGPTVLIFFGALSTAHPDSFNNCHKLLSSHYGAQIMGITANLTSDTTKNWNYGFPILSDDCGALARFFQVLDPMGGGVYPLDKLIIIDSNGQVRADATVENKLFLFCKQGKFEKVLTHEEMIINLVESLEYLKGL